MRRIEINLPARVRRACSSAIIYSFVLHFRNTATHVMNHKGTKAQRKGRPFFVPLCNRPVLSCFLTRLFGRVYSPPREEGWTRHKVNVAKPPLMEQTGW